MKIDAFTHIVPGPWLSAIGDKAPEIYPYYKQITADSPSLINMETRFRIMDQFGSYRQVVTLPYPPFEHPHGRPKVVRELAHIANEAMAELVQNYPQRFLGFAATLPLPDVEASLKELAWAIEHLGAKGLQLPANVNGEPLDNPIFLPIFEQMNHYGLPMWLHPARAHRFPDYSKEDESLYNACLIFGWPYETAVTLTRLALQGFLERFSNLTIISHHGGGLIPYMPERIRWGCEVIREKSPLISLQGIYADTALNGWQPALDCALAFFGPDKLLFGSDFPFDLKMGAQFVEEAIQIVEGLSVSPEQREAIYWKNLAQLLKLSESELPS